MGDIRGRIPILVFLIVVALSIGGLMGRLGSRPPMSPVETGDTGTQTSEHTTPMLAIHVSGMVMAPGVVVIPAGSIVADAIDAAGGLRSGARIDRVNLAAAVSAGEHIVVPGPGSDGEQETPAAGASEGLISLSTATATELEELPGVGPVLAERIVSFREQNGPFGAVEDLLEVPGIGEAKLAALRDLVVP